MSVRRLVPGSLTGRLVATAVALVALVTLVIAVATAAALRGYLLGQLDDRVRDAHSRALAGPAHTDRPGSAPDGDGRGPDGDNLFGAGVEAFVVGDGMTGGSSGRVFTGGGTEDLDTAALQRLATVPADNEPHSTAVPGHGDYRVLAERASLSNPTDGSRTTGVLVTGVPSGDVSDTVTRLVRFLLLFLLLGVAAAFAAALWLVRRQLRPLREVAATAHEVATLPLASGEVGVTARVPPQLTDERSEVGQVGAALNTLLGHVESALAARHRSEQQVRQFVGDASHELRTPLATILGYAEFSRRGSEPSEPPVSGAEQLARSRQALDKVESEATRMTALVEDLLLLARLDAGRPLERIEVDLTRIALETVADAQMLGPDHRWVLDLPDEPVQATGDLQRLHQVFTNLLTNARRHTPPGTTVTVSLRPGAVLCVHDDGPGIPEHLRGQVFERFTRGDTARTRASGGAGLGLSLVSAIVAGHGGEVTVDSRPGSTCVTVTLPG